MLNRWKRLTEWNVQVHQYPLLRISSACLHSISSFGTALALSLFLLTGVGESQQPSPAPSSPPTYEQVMNAIWNSADSKDDRSAVRTS